VEATWAVWKLGATPQPVSFRLPKSELEAIMELAKTPVVVAQKGVEVSRPVLDIDDLLALSDDDSDLPDAIAPVLKAPTSGGSTGRPKLILSGSRGVTAREMPAAGVWQGGPDSTAIIPAPLYHNGPFGMMQSMMSMGAHVVVMPRFDP